uniref:Uncharacterized protein n=1 Tax=Arundo donax TaxID=35708 RepID=A0A0A9FPB8_ARUDO
MSFSMSGSCQNRLLRIPFAYM